MPSAPAKPCRHPRCAAFAAPGSAWCAAHVPAARAQVQAEVAAKDERRGSAASRGYGARWREVSLNFRRLYTVSQGYLVCTPLWTHNLACQFGALRLLAQSRGESLRFMTPGTGAGARFLAEFPIYTFHPTQSRVVASEVVDHIRPHRGDQTLFWAEWNLQAISKADHDEKTAKYDGGFRGAPAPVAKPATAGGLL